MGKLPNIPRPDGTPESHQRVLLATRQILLGLNAAGAKQGFLSEAGGKVDGDISAKRLTAETLALTGVPPNPPIANTVYAGAGGWIVIERKIVSGTPETVDFVAGIDSRFVAYRLTYHSVRCDIENNTILRLRMGTGAGPTWDAGATVYSYAAHQKSDDGVDSASFSTGDSSISVCCSFLGNGAGRSAGGELYFDNLSGGLYKTVDYLLRAWAPVRFGRGGGAGQYFNTAAVTGLRFFFTVGAGVPHFTSGTFMLEGLLNA